MSVILELKVKAFEASWMTFMLLPFVRLLAPWNMSSPDVVIKKMDTNEKIIGSAYSKQTNNL